jgi:hypothetical protein
MQPSRREFAPQPSEGITEASAESMVMVVVMSTVTIWTLVGYATGETVGGAAAGVVKADVARVVGRVVGRAVGMLDEVGFAAEGCAAEDEGSAAVEDEAGIGAEPMNPSPIWNTLTELTCQYALAKSAGLFWT